MSTRGTSGQASVEFVALVPLMLVVMVIGWQFVVVGHTIWAADAAARVGARAAALGDDGRAAARRALPRSMLGDAKISAPVDGRVNVSVQIPGVFGLPRLGRIGGSAYYEPQV